MQRHRIYEVEIVDLKQETDYIDRYVSLRNRRHRALLSKEVTIEETTEWLRKEGIEVRCIVENGQVTGAVALNIDRGGELTVFAAEENRGTGTELIGVMKEVGAGRKLDRLWAWVEENNMPSRRAFEKNGFTVAGSLEKEYGGRRLSGVIFEKILSGDV